MIEHIIKTLLDRNESIIRKAIIVIFALFILYCIDTFTPYPSLYFTKEKYEAISILNKISSDTTFSDEIRANAKSDLYKIKDIYSFKDYRSSLGEKSSQINERVKQTITTNEIKTGISIIDIFSSYLFIILMINNIWVTLALSAYFSRDIPLKKKRKLYGVALKLGIVNTLFSYFYLCYDPLNNIVYENDNIFMASVISSIIFGFGIIFVTLIETRFKSINKIP